MGYELKDNDNKIKLEQVVESLDSVDEQYRNFYGETTDGRFGLRLDLPFQGDFDKVYSALGKEREASKDKDKSISSLKAQLAMYDGIDVNKYKQDMIALDKFRSTDNDVGKLKTQNADLTLKFEEMQKSYNDALSTLEKFKVERKEQNLKSTALKALRAMHIEPYAEADGLLWATNMLEADDNGEIRVKDGIEGFNAGLGVESWANLLAQKKPYLFGGSVGGGAGGSGAKFPVGADDWTNTGANGGINATKFCQAYAKDPQGTMALAKQRGLDKTVREQFGFLLK